MFNKKEQKPAGPNAMNQFGQGTIINGDVVADGDMRIDGKITGSVTSKSKVVLGSTGSIEGDINCQNAYIDGRVNGTIEVSELLILSKTAHVTGDIKMRKLVVEDGAKFNGKCSMGLTVARNTEVLEQQPISRSKVSGIN
jgi:cytoskeletal protein CcmA (bactofilin family)